MRSLRADLWLAALLAACLGGAAGVARAQGDDAAVSAPDGAASAPEAAIAPGGAASAASVDPRAVRIEDAADKLREDPLLSGKHKEHRLHWKSTDKSDPKKTNDSSLLNWIASLARFLNDTSRFLLWGVIAVLVALALVSARHLVQLRAFRRRAAAESAVSHVRDLDVRPESLPDDVGAAAWALWQAGQVPAALSLLYRASLSRLIHRFNVPITASATEGECLDLARGRLEPTALRYVTQVVRAWEANTYGGRSLSSAMGESLCTGFGQRLDAATPPAAETST
ncbi:MAG: DUF4129 domain-containing protein [Burkholderiaceae bacterium]